MQYLFIFIIFFHLLNAYSDEKIQCNSGLESFKKNVYPLLRSSCVNCHGDQGSAIGHSVSNVEEAYETSKFFTTFPDTGNSRFIDMVKRQHWLSYDPQEKGTSEEKISSSLEKWWNEGEFECQDYDQWVSTKLIIPKTLPNWNSGNFYVLSWDLGKENPKFAGVVFELNIQRFTEKGDTTPASYQVSYPKIKSSGFPLKIEGISLLISGKKRVSSNLYSDISVSAFSSGFITLSTEQMIVFQELPEDNIQIAFRVFEKADKPIECKDIITFENQFEPNIRKNCISCHNGNSINNFSIPENSEDLCREVLTRHTYPKLPERSPFLGFVYQRKKAHPFVPEFVKSSSIIRWFYSEKN